MHDNADAQADDDAALVHAFETLTLPPDRFDHAAHVRVAWWYLKHGTLGAAIDRFTRAIRAFASKHGAADKYHETITVAYLLLIAERLDGARGLTWTAFAARNPDVLEQKPPLLARYYDTATLQSARARRSFVMPDRGFHAQPPRA